MANPEDIKRAMDGVTVWNDWAEDKKKKGEAPVADFSGHRFGTISFAAFNFPGIVQFSEAVFTETTSFRDAKFFDDANFNDVTFKASVSFDHARFHNYANFTSAEFKEEFTVSGAIFSGEVHFIKTWFNCSEVVGTSFNSSLTRFY